MITGTVSLYEWLSACIVGFVALTINLYMLKMECKKRKSIDNAQFTTKSSQINSLLCMICGVIHSFSIFTAYFDGFCFFSPNVYASSIGIQAAFMGFYQLDRLSYCFSQSQVYSNKGYPKSVFIVMNGFGVIFVILMLIWPWLFQGPSRNCYIDNTLTFHYTIDIKDRIIHHRGGSSDSFYWSFITAGFYAWDLITLLLYVNKVILFRKYKDTNIDIHRRIMSILYKVLILTELYAVFAIGNVVLLLVDGYHENAFVDYVVYPLSIELLCISMCYSMYLMQNHNNKEYVVFIRYICCCCQGFVSRDLLLYNLDNQMEKNSAETKDGSRDSTLYETHDISSKHGRIQAKPFEMSVDTVTSAHL